MKQAGQIVLFRFPHTDLEEGKLRPALLLARLPDEYDDWLKRGKYSLERLAT
jgi:mRNA interferase MazF